MVALVTAKFVALTFFIASVCVTLFPRGTVPNDTDDGVDVREDACTLHVAISWQATANKTSKKRTAYRREGPPG